MRLILNPTKPIYLDKKNKIIRSGNFPETGKEIEYEDDLFVQIFKQMIDFVDRKELEKFALNKYSVKKTEFDSVIDYLINEKFVITEDEYNKLLSSKKYNRQEMYFHMFSGEQKTINDYKNKKILVLGLGGIGSIVTELLIRAGFENFTIIDCDKVEESNLIRQTAYYSKDIGKLKIDALEERIKSININCIVDKVNIEIKETNDVREHIKASDLVICTLDKPTRIIRRLINDVCVEYDKPVIFSGFAEHVGMIGPFIVPHKTACLECIDRNIDEEFLANVKIAPSFGPLCNLIASIVSSEVINYFVNFNPDSLLGCTLMINMHDYNINKIEWKKRSNCKKCGDEK